MPIVSSNYTAPKWLLNKHLQTVYPHFFRSVEAHFFTRERILTPDNDFLDLDWSQVGSKTLVLICHGLEGDSRRHYMVGMVKAVNLAGYDALSLNFRGCSGELNRRARAYHSGATDDLDWVIQHALKKYDYEQVVLIGFSLGGNLVLKYAGEITTTTQKERRLAAVITYSVPCNLAGSCLSIMQGVNRIYEMRFLHSLKEKTLYKIKHIPVDISSDEVKALNRLVDFDDLITAPVHGFKDAGDYYIQCSSKRFLPYIQVPTLIVNAQNDTFLSPECYPVRIAEQHKWVYLEMPEHGGHVGFYASLHDGGMYYSEKRALAFIAEKVS